MLSHSHLRTIFFCLVICLHNSLLACPAKADTKLSKASEFPGKGKEKDWLEANLLFNEGNVLKKKGVFDQAIAKYSKAIAIYPFDAEYYNNCGSAYKGKGDYARAEAAYRKSLSMKGTFWQGWANLGSVLAKLGKTAESINSYKKALSLGPPDAMRESIQHDLAELSGAEAAKQ